MNVGTHCNLYRYIKCKQKHVCSTATGWKWTDGEVALEPLLPLLLTDSWFVKWWAAFCFNIYSGQEYPAVVEFAPFQKISKKKLKKKDAKAGSIEEGTEIQI